MTQFSPSPYAEKYASDTGVFKFLQEKVGEVPKYENKFSLKKTELGNLSIRANLSFERILETLKRYSEKPFFRDEDDDQWKILEAGLYWKQPEVVKSTCNKRGFPTKMWNEFLPSIDFIIFDRELLDSYLILKSEYKSESHYLEITDDFKIIRKGVRGEIILKNRIQEELCDKIFMNEPKVKIKTKTLISCCYEDRDDSIDLYNKRFDNLRQVAKRLNKKIENTFGLKGVIKIGVTNSSRTS